MSTINTKEKKKPSLLEYIYTKPGLVIKFFITANNAEIFEVPMTPGSESKSVFMGSNCFSYSSVSSPLCFK